MTNTTQFIPGFHLQSLRRKPRTEAQKLAIEKEKLCQHSLSRLGDYFSSFIPLSLLNQSESGGFSRRRLFSKENTFWAFFGQILDADGGCREVVRKIQAYRTSQ